MITARGFRVEKPHSTRAGCCSGFLSLQSGVFGFQDVDDAGELLDGLFELVAFFPKLVL